MADVVLNNYSDDSKIKQYIQRELMQRVFHDIPTSKLNTGAFSIINEYISQATEQMAFTSSFYYNESFITKAVLPDSIYAEAAIFNIGYGFANPSATLVLLELKLDDLFKITQNSENKNTTSGLYEFILDKNTIINMKDGQSYSLDYDISLQYLNDKTAKDTRNGAWIVQYLNDEPNSISINKEKYISYRVTDNWLCLFLNVSEYKRQTQTVINNMANGVPNPDTLITCNDHICGFDVVYVEPATKLGESDRRIPLRKDHIVPINATITDGLPYVHYIMDNSQTIRLMWQLQGNKAFVPKLNSRYEITVYTCHGKSANFSEAPNEQPNVITATTRFKNNANVMKAAFIIAGSLGGTDIGTAENVRRKTIEAYNTANVISTDHDIEEWFKTFYFENILFPFFFKRRDDPWGRIWSGFLALTDKNNDVYRTNTLHAFVTYDQLYNNGPNIVSNNEIIIPPGWIWKYKDNSELYTVVPYTTNNSIIATAKTMLNANGFTFANPFGIRIQKSPFAIGYFNPWINEALSVTRVPQSVTYIEDSSQIYHATPLTVNIKRTYMDDFYHISFWLDVSQNNTINLEKWITQMNSNGITPVFDSSLWTYFQQPKDLYANKIAMLSLQPDKQELPFTPELTYLCVSEKNLDDEGYWRFGQMWIQDNSEYQKGNTKRIDVSITNMDGLIGSDDVWGDNGLCEAIPVSGNNNVDCYGLTVEDPVVFEQNGSNDYYSMTIKTDLHIIDEITLLPRPAKITHIRFKVTSQHRTERTKFGEASLFQIGESMTDVNVNVSFEYVFTDVAETQGGIINTTYTIANASEVYIPYPLDSQPTQDEFDGMWEFDIPTYESNDGIPETTAILYADMKPSPTSATVSYYRIRFDHILSKIPFYVKNESLQLEKNNLRVVLHAYMNGGETGYIEMRPVKRDADGTYLFETDIYPLNELVDVDNRIIIASTNNGGGSWNSTTGSSVVIDATNPSFRISVLFKAETNTTMPSSINGDESFDGYYINDEFDFDQFSLIQELKEMRSVVNFTETGTPTTEQYVVHQNLMRWIDYNVSYNTLYQVKRIAEKQQVSHVPITEQGRIELQQIVHNSDETGIYDKGFFTDVEKVADTLGLDKETDPYLIFKQTFDNMLNAFTNTDGFEEHFTFDDENVQRIYENDGTYYTDPTCTIPLTNPSEDMCYYIKDDRDVRRVTYHRITTDPDFSGSIIDIDITDTIIMWQQVNEIISNYGIYVDDELFNGYNLNSGVEIQLIPLVEYSLMNSEQFADFVHTFTQVHKAIEPVIFKRLEGNNYLDCKLIATYGKPHTYCSDQQYKLTTNEFWPNLNIQISFDVKLYNKSLASNTIAELKLKIQAYFNRITTVHTPVDLLSMNNNIYVSHLIQQLEEHSNVAYMKFNGWYTNEKSDPSGNYMDANVQAIYQKWKHLEDMPTEELERFVPEMFVLEDRNIEINVLDDYLF